MAKFTKLITGDTVASGSGRAWKKLRIAEIVTLVTSDGYYLVASDGTILMAKE